MNESLIQYGPKGNSIEIENILTHIFSVNNEISNPDIKPTPLCIWGTHGLGKTEMVRDYAKSRGWQFEYIAPAQFEEMGDLHGMPSIDNSSVIGKTVFNPPDWVPTKEGPGILLIDDINRADDRILRGCMQLLQNYELSSWKLPEKWQIVATANPEGADYSVTPMDDAMLTRMIHTSLIFDHKVWAQWASNSGVDKRGISFVLTYPELINSERTTPRSLTQFFQLINNIDDLKKNINLVLSLALSTLDQITASSFVNFVNDDLQILVEPQEILNSTNFNEIKKRINQLSKDSEGEKRTDRLSTVSTRLYLYLISSNYKIQSTHKENLIQYFLLDFIPKDLTMSLYIDLLKSSNDDIKKMLRDKRLAKFLIDAM
ncbi:AAA family ATPase [Flavobacteriales bacterium]|nr:AAA family ATPase [Flavobacteriales bacterium]MDB4710752.1 AAA family ATPase [Flavobacteriales bacterium]